MSHFLRWPWPRILAHRGAGLLAPENTLGALRVGCAHGFRAVEFDAMAPRDDVPVLMHDSTLDRTAGIAEAVTAKSAEELSRLDAGSWHSVEFAAEPVPRLAQALEYCRAQSIWPNVEIKPAPGHEVRTGALVAQTVARAYADVLQAGREGAGFDARLPLLSSFSSEALVAARGAEPALPVALLSDAAPPDWSVLLQRLGAVSLHLNHRYLDAATAHAVKRAGYWLLCYTVNDPGRARELLRWGVDAFCTDRIDLIRPDFA